MTLTKSSALKDLGLESGATEELIKAAYRKLAMKHHPDREGGSEVEFKKIQSAYEFLTTPQKPDRQNQNRHADDVMAEMMRHMMSSGNWGGVNFSEGNKIVRTFTSHIRVNLEEAFQGCTKNVNFDIAGGESFKIDIPRGYTPNCRLRMIDVKDRQGNEIIIDVRLDIITPDRNVRWAVQPNLYGGAIEGSGNIEQHILVAWLDVLLGGWFSVKTIDGESVDVRIPQGVEPGTLLKIHNRGYWKDVHGSARGDVLLRVIHSVPSISNLANDQLERACKIFSDEIKQRQAQKDPSTENQEN